MDKIQDKQKVYLKVFNSKVRLGLAIYRFDAILLTKDHIRPKLNAGYKCQAQAHPFGQSGLVRPG